MLHPNWWTARRWKLFRNEDFFWWIARRSIAHAARLNSILWVTAGLDVEELSHEVHLNARRHDDNEDLNNRPGADVALVVL